AYESYNNLHYLVYNLPYGSIWEAPSIFLVPASLGLALLIGYSSYTFSRITIRFGNSTKRKVIRIFSFAVVLILIISASIPWWTGQTSGNPISGPPLKLNLYQIPSG